MISIIGSLYQASNGSIKAISIIIIIIIVHLLIHFMFHSNLIVYSTTV